MFFGSSRKKTRAFDTISHRVSNTSTLFHRYISFYPEVERDAASSLAMLNAYSVACHHESAKKLKKAAKEAKKYDGNLSNTDKVQN